MARLCLTADDFLNHNTIFGIQTIVSIYLPYLWFHSQRRLTQTGHPRALLSRDRKGEDG